MRKTGTAHPSLLRGILLQKLFPESHKILKIVYKCPVKLGIVIFQAFKQRIAKEMGTTERPHPSLKGAALPSHIPARG